MNDTNTVKQKAQYSISNNAIDNTDHEVQSLDESYINETQSEHSWMYNIKYLVAGILFGIVLIKAQVMSWFRIQEMFRLQSFHMYGVIGTAVVTGIISIWIIKKFKLKTIRGKAIVFSNKKFNKGQIIGGLAFGFGWAMTGACPGPLFAQVGAGFTVVFVVIASAIAGTWVYGKFRNKLPH